MEEATELLDGALIALGFFALLGLVGLVSALVPALYERWHERRYSRYCKRLSCYGRGRCLECEMIDCPHCGEQK